MTVLQECIAKADFWSKYVCRGKPTATLVLEDIIDVAKELAKLGDKKTKLESQLHKLDEIMSKTDYEQKVPLGVRTNNAEKKDSLCIELKHINEAVAALKTSG
uniref:Val_tRNA-synt_C domain-containing protein n=1 Tax=Ascaris lumbricoides TaxID=6252 RepID=A0A0M3HG53_ASCLU